VDTEMKLTVPQKGGGGLPDQQRYYQLLKDSVA
jgi:hypothetical protein